MGNIKLGGYKLLSFDKIPSTQTSALDMVAHGAARDKTVIVAAAQSAGRGRYRRPWVSHHGNLYASFIFDAPERNPQLSYVVGVAVAETLISFGVAPTIKWPNDILIDGAKMCGILIEYAAQFVIVGIGINVKSNPTVPEYKTTKLENYADVSLTELLSRLMQYLDKWRRRDFAVVRARWMELAAALNKTVSYRGMDAELIGINENGALILRRGSEYFLTWGDEIVMRNQDKK